MNKHYDELQNLLSSGKEDALAINQDRVDQTGKGFSAIPVFDFDGVLLRENSLAEKGYGWLVRSFREDNFNPEDIEVSESDVRQATAFRPNIKGKSMSEKVEAFDVEFGKSDLKMPVDRLVRRWFDALKYIVLDQFADKPDAYRMPGARELLEKATSKGKVFGVTANEYQHAHFLMEFVGLKKYFTEIVGYPINSLPKTSKASLLADLLFRHNIKPEDACYIGDGTSDIRAGKKAGTFTIGIANASMPISLIDDQTEKNRIIEKSIKNGMKLIAEGCDILATSPMAYNAISKYFG